MPLRFVAGIAMALAVGAAHGADGKIQPGQWRTTDTVLEMSNPLLPPEAVARRKAKPVVAEYCVRSDDLLELVVGKDQAGLCEGTVKTSGGRISGTRKCSGGKTTRTIEGTYSATKIDTQREVQLQTAQGTALTKSHVVSERIGECQ
ncbi:MAG: DUF3617 family protein [Burkholderiaceae bacterium]